MKRLMLIVAVLLVGCGEWQPEGFPVAVNLDGSLSAEQREAVTVAAERINYVAGFDVFDIQADNGRAIQRGRISVDDKHPGKDTIAVATIRKFSCRIHMGETTKLPVDTATHELLHCLGFDHDDNDLESIMSTTCTQADLQLEFRQHHVDRLREMAGLEPLEY